MLRFISRLLRAALITAMGSALLAKLMLESHAEPDTEEIDLIAIFEGKRLVSEADPFYGGHIVTMFGGVELDLRKTHPAPTGIDLDATILMGGVSLVVPEGWRVVYQGDLYMSGWSDETSTTANEDVPVITITGRVLLGGLRASARSSVEAVA